MTKKIEAIFREEKLTAVKEALLEMGIVGMNVPRNSSPRLGRLRIAVMRKVKLMRTTRPISTRSMIR